MRITCTGHAGLFIETAHGSIFCDPWRSPAYFASWFVFPDNSGIDFGAYRPDYLYVSHLHRDHLIRRFLRALVPKRRPFCCPTTRPTIYGRTDRLGFTRSCRRRTASPSSWTASGS